MSPDQRSGSDGETSRPDLLHLESERIEAERLAQVLAAIENGDAPDLDPIEDPALESMATTVRSLRGSLEAASTRATFGAFHQRSRSRVMAAAPVPRAVDEPQESFLQRWNSLFTSVSAAAAASVATFVVTVLAIGGSAGPAAPLASVEAPESTPALQVSSAPATPNQTRVNLTALSIDQQLSVYVGLLERLDALEGEGLTADEALLRDLADTSATVKRTIERDPSVTGADAFVAMLTTFRGTERLKEATVDTAQDQQALDTAQATAESAYVTAARYLGDPERLPTADEAAAALAATIPDARSPEPPASGAEAAP